MPRIEFTLCGGTVRDATTGCRRHERPRHALRVIHTLS
jgi:hypothetical protein